MAVYLRGRIHIVSSMMARPAVRLV